MKKNLFGMALFVMMFSLFTFAIPVKASTLPETSWQIYEVKTNTLWVFKGEDANSGICWKGIGNPVTIHPELENLYKGQCTKAGAWVK